MFEPEPIIKKSPTKKQKLLAEKEKLEKQLLEYGSAVSESQIYHIKNRIKQIDKEIAELEDKMASGVVDETIFTKHGELKKKLEEQMLEWEDALSKV